MSRTLKGPLGIGYRGPLIIGLVLLSGCSIKSYDSGTEGMRCVHGHDEAHGGGYNPDFVCDEWIPKEQVTP